MDNGAKRAHARHLIGFGLHQAPTACMPSFVPGPKNQNLLHSDTGPVAEAEYANAVAKVCGTAQRPAALNFGCCLALFDRSVYCSSRALRIGMQHVMILRRILGLIWVTLKRGRRFSDLLWRV